jgi:hypothetical protein
MTGDGDDPAATASDHAGQDSPGAQERAAQVDIYASPPLVAVDLPDRPTWPKDTGVVHQQDHQAKLLLDLAYHLRNGLLICHVCRNGDGASARLFDEGYRLSQLVGRAGNDSHGRTRPGQTLRDCTPNAPSTAGHDGDLPS